MAYANDGRYGGGAGYPQPQPYAGHSYADDDHTRSPSPYYNPPTPASSNLYVAGGAAPTAASSTQHLVGSDAGSSHAYRTPSGPSGPSGPAPTQSPFDSIFDDPAGHAYRQQQQQQQHQPPAPSGGAASDYYGYGYGGRRTPSEDLHLAHDGIPLQERGGKYDHEAAAAAAGALGGGSAGAGRRARPVRFGELGMLGANRKRIPWVTYLFTTIQIAVFIAEIVKNGILTGSPIMIHPQFNPMIGPSSYVLINMGSRYVPCMHNVAGIQSSTEHINWRCPNTTSDDTSNPSNTCTLSELCGFGGVPEPRYDGNADQSPEPNQWFRFILPMFMHAGVIHIGFNLLLQLTMGADMERSIGPIRFFLVYVTSGIFGFVLGGNYAATGIQSTGASGSLFGIIALTLLDLLYSWRDRRNPVKDLLFVVLDVVISFVLGLLPGLDNFSHIGGFLNGLCLGISVLHSPNQLRRRIGEPATSGPYQAGGPGPDDEAATETTSFFRAPAGFFKGRRPLWWAWWLLRAGAIVAVVVLFVELLNNFYRYHNTCSWCKYLSCLPVKNWCEIGNLTTTTTTKKRGLLTNAGV